MGIKVLDCTLRDGAYVVDGDFGIKRICNIINSLQDSGVDIIECGWLRDCLSGENSVFYNIPEELNHYIDKKTSEFALMFDYGRYNIEKLLQNIGLVDIIRIAFYKKSLDEISFAVEKVKSKGYKVFLQPSNVKEYKEKDLIKLCKRANYIGADACYVVDSFGSMFPEELEKIIPIFDEEVDPNIQIGFHSHNNIQLSFGLSIKFINEMKRDIVVDSSLSGIGRGAGNTKTELLLEYLNRYKSGEYKTDLIWKALENKILPDENWEYSVEKGLKGINNIHP